jgi:hypothetical protein
MQRWKNTGNGLWVATNGINAPQTSLKRQFSTPVYNAGKRHV